MKTFAAIVLALLVCVQMASGEEQATAYKYVGNNFSQVFHKPSCEFARRIWPTRVELFHFRQEAIAAEYKPCNWCLPKRWWTCRGKLLALPVDGGGKEDVRTEGQNAPVAPDMSTPAPADGN